MLTPEGWRETDLVISEGCLRPGIPAGSVPTLDARGLWVLPGLIDLHGDAFERVYCPRPGVRFPLEMALQEHDRLLLANGITTFFFSIADSFEPGIRGRESARRLVEAVKSSARRLRVNGYVHLRHEESQVNGLDELVGWMESRRIDLLSFNDHLPDPDDRAQVARFLKSLRLREHLSEDDAYRMIREAVAQREQGRSQCDELARRARTLGIPTASHDDDLERLRQSVRRGVRLIEFPMNGATALRAKKEGLAVLMGAPNVVHGRSHLGWLSVREAVRSGSVDLLCSDYHYPSLMAAPFILAKDGLCSFETAWRMVSAVPAQQVGLAHRKGEIKDGYDADLVLLDPAANGSTPIRGVIVGGRIAALFPDVSR